MSGRVMAAVWTATLLTLSAAAPPIDRPTTWSGDVVIDEVIETTAAAPLTITPGTVIEFSGGGRLCCDADITANGVVFRSNDILDGEPRISQRRGACEFRACEFRGLRSSNVKHVDASIRMLSRSFVLRDCVLENCSALEVILAKEARIENNSTRIPVGHGIVATRCDRAWISGNTFTGGQATTTSLVLCGSKNCEIVSNRFFGPGVAVALKTKSIDNRIVANAAFNNSHAFIVTSGSARNLFLSDLAMNAKLCGFLGKDCGPGDVIRNCVVWRSGLSGINFRFDDSNDNAVPPLVIRNCVFADCPAGVSLRGDVEGSLLGNNVFWRVKTQFRGPTEGIERIDNRVVAPLFVDPEAGNFRPRSTFFGHAQDSPLLETGYPKGVNVGLYP